MGFEKLDGQAGCLIAYTTTIVNNTPANLVVRDGGATIDGRVVTQPTVISGHEHLDRQLRKRIDAIEISCLPCFTNGFLAHDNFFPQSNRAQELIVQSHSWSTVSSVIRDPRYSPLFCSRKGCFPKGTIRHSIHVGSHEYIFKWQGQSLMNCGK